MFQIIDTLQAFYQFGSFNLLKNLVFFKEVVQISGFDSLIKNVILQIK
jgi:hypothetical protein